MHTVHRFFFALVGRHTPELFLATAPLEQPDTHGTMPATIAHERGPDRPRLYTGEKLTGKFLSFCLVPHDTWPQKDEDVETENDMKAK